MKKIVLVLLFAMFSFFAFCQENIETPASNENPFKKSFKENASFFTGFTPLMYIVVEDDTESAPNPISYPLYAGVIWPRHYWISIQPSLKIFTGYYFINNARVLPAEIENRTGFGINILLNLPVVFQANFWDKTNIKLSAGLAFLFRFAFLAPGVDEGDSGYYGTAGEDIKKINSGFYEGAKFIYLSTSADWMFNLSNGMEIGPEVSFYIPVVTLLSDFSLDGTMISAGVKIIF